jgi:putative oxygen-independent coproporphyrinogen III oxidase
MIPIYPANSISQAPLQGGTTVSGLTNPPPLSLYIHIPWCVRKCPYCDFNSHESKQEIPEVAYVDALIADLEQATPLIWGRKMHSVFFGGGTPSLFSAESIDKILSHVRMLTPLEYGAEITLEANPGTIDTAHFLGYKEAGVNRVSIGIQSFNENHLKALGRIHNREQAIQAAELAINTFDQVNLDVMYALPEQALDQALQDAQMACDLKPAHLSFYHLTLEPNTPFHRTPPSLPDDDTSAEMQEQIESLLAQHGYDNYETSAFSQAGKQCKHNLNYWTFGDYLGIGAGAHSKLSFHDKIIRQARHKHPKRYMEFTAEGKAIDQEWQIKQEDLGFEFMMNALRLSNGFDKDLIALRTGIPFITLQKQVKQAIKLGLISDELQLIKPTLKGRRFLNNLLDIFLT